MLFWGFHRKQFMGKCGYLNSVKLENVVLGVSQKTIHGKMLVFKFCEAGKDLKSGWQNNNHVIFFSTKRSSLQHWWIWGYFHRNKKKFFFYFFTIFYVWNKVKTLSYLSVWCETSVKGLQKYCHDSTTIVFIHEKCFNSSGKCQTELQKKNIFDIFLRNKRGFHRI